ncbi:glycine cleavage system protein R [Paraconexibacter sp.]|uniref:glycine cleavage system protein R n=1 Tax=Paraconexibacter sp. TaxID=2949640 RepID=UPI003568EADB
MLQLAVSAVGRDRPGIVAAVTGVLVAHGADIADAQMGVLSGRFTMMLIVDAPDDLDEGAFLGDLLEIGRDLGLDVVSANRIDPVHATGVLEPTHVVTVSGVDHPGIVHAITHQLARHGVNVTDLQTRRLADGDDPLHAMMLEVVPPADLDLEQLRDALSTVAGERELDLSVRPIPAD